MIQIFLTVSVSIRWQEHFEQAYEAVTGESCRAPPPSNADMFALGEQVEPRAEVKGGQLIAMHCMRATQPGKTPCLCSYELYADTMIAPFIAAHIMHFSGLV